MKRLIVMFLLAGLGASTARAQSQPAQEPKPSMEIYGFAMLDMGHDFKQIHPDWFDTLRVTKLPSFQDQFGKDNSTFAGVRQSRLGVKTSTPTSLGDLKTIFEFELFGTGVDSGQTTFRLRHAWGELGQFAAGQYLEPVYRSGRVPQLARVPGADRPGVVPQRPVPLDPGGEGAQQPDVRARAPRRQRRPGRLRGPYRAAEHQSPLPDAGPLGRLQGDPERGATRASRASCAGSSGTTRSPTSSTSRAAPPAGASISRPTSRPARRMSFGRRSWWARASRTR